MARSIPNLLGLFRIAMTPLLVVIILADTAPGYSAAVALLLLMSISDVIDGKLARHWQVVSPFGIFLDTISDKIFVAGALIPMVELHLLPGWIALIIIVRDFAVSGLRSYAAAEGQVIAAREWGKQKLVITVAALIWRLAAAAVLGPGAPPLMMTFADRSGAALLLAQFVNLWPLPLALAVIWTVGSGIEYFWNARRLLRDQWLLRPPATPHEPVPPQKSSVK